MGHRVDKGRVNNTASELATQTPLIKVELELGPPLGVLASKDDVLRGLPDPFSSCLIRTTMSIIQVGLRVAHIPTTHTHTHTCARVRMHTHRHPLTFTNTCVSQSLFL